MITYEYIIKLQQKLFISVLWQKREQGNRERNRDRDRERPNSQE